MAFGSAGALWTVDPLYRLKPAPPFSSGGGVPKNALPLSLFHLFLTPANRLRHTSGRPGGRPEVDQQHPLRSGTQLANEVLAGTALDLNTKNQAPLNHRGRPEGGPWVDVGLCFWVVSFWGGFGWGCHILDCSLFGPQCLPPLCRGPQLAGYAPRAGGILERPDGCGNVSHDLEA
eukprot:604523-Amphidinium_carterae.2